VQVCFMLECGLALCLQGWLSLWGRHTLFTAQREKETEKEGGRERVRKRERITHDRGGLQFVHGCGRALCLQGYAEELKLVHGCAQGILKGEVSLYH